VLDDVPPELAMVGVGVIASLVLVTLPVLVAGMVGQVQGDDRDVGWLASADMTGSAIASLCVMALMARINWRTTVYRAIVLVVAGNLVSIFTDGLVALMAVRMTTGFGNGLILSIVFVGLCRSKSPDRFFGAYTFAQLGLQALSLAAMPTVLDAHGMPAVFLILAAASGFSGLLVTFFPTRMVPRADADPSGRQGEERAAPHRISGSPALRVAFAVAGQAVYFLAPAAVWGYFERIGRGFALDIGEVGSALGIASAIGIGGALSVIVLGTRFRRMALMGLGTTISIAAMVLLMDGSGFYRYLIAASLFNFAWNFTFPYQMGVLSVLDPSGAVGTVSLVAQLLGLSFGPLLASFLLTGEGYDVILWSCIGCYLASMIMFGISGRVAARDDVDGGTA
jgi:predicted MFS family arabinose efflux permease